MTDINPSELGAFTNNLPNKEGLKKLCDAVNDIPAQLTAGDNISISDGVISATDTKYTAGDNIQISEQNVISATDTKYTAGTGISISDQNVISASGGGDWSLNTDNDWSNIFERDGNNFYTKVKKDVYIYWINGYINFGFLPKGFVSSQSYIVLAQPNHQASGTSFLIYILYIEFSSVRVKEITLNLETGQTSARDITTAKSTFKVYVKD